MLKQWQKANGVDIKVAKQDAAQTKDEINLTFTFPVAGRALVERLDTSHLKRYKR